MLGKNWVPGLVKPPEITPEMVGLKTNGKKPKAKPVVEDDDEFEAF
jgi:hypothetical protein